MKAGEEVSRASAAGRLMKQQSIGTQGVKTVVFHDNFFAKNAAEHQRAERRAGQVNNVSSPEQARQLEEARLANDLKA
jgi:hypothetical protein